MPKYLMTGHADRVTTHVLQDANSNPVVVSDVCLPLLGRCQQL